MPRFQDDLPLDGMVWVNWKDLPREKGKYIGYHASNTRRCGVILEGRTQASWIDREILEVYS